MHSDWTNGDRRQLSGRIHEGAGELTDDHVTWIAGRLDRLPGTARPFERRISSQLATSEQPPGQADG